MQSGRVLSHANTGTKVVALTFDDGPDPTYTPRVLNILARYGVRATFFEQGRMIRRYPDIARQTLRAGHVLGNHTETHPYLERLSQGGVAAEMSACDEALSTFVGVRTDLFRSPRGAWNPDIYHETALRNDYLILWSVALEHSDTPTPEGMSARVLKLVKPGGIILMHDGANRSRETTIQALPLLLDGLHARGYRIVTVPELLKIPGSFTLPARTDSKFYSRRPAALSH